MSKLVSFLLAISLTVVSHGMRKGYAADTATAAKLLNAGQYAQCLKVTEEGLKETAYNENWRHLKVQAEMALGRYTDALKTIDEGLKRFPTSIRMRWRARDVLRHNGQMDRAKALMAEIEQWVSSAPYRYSDSANRLILGRFFLEKNADPRQVLEVFYDPVKKRRVDYPDVYVAIGDLALEKNDFKLAADEFRVALKLDSDNADIHFGLARALASSDPEASQAELAKTLEINPNHFDALLQLVDGFIDAEAYAHAKKILDRIAEINSKHAKMWAYRAVLAHIDNDLDQEKKCRDTALKSWPTNPEVDYLIGLKLSQKYRFAEGAASQRRALAFDANFRPARIQLAQDLLRLGQEDEGWALADSVSETDGYNIAAHNLVTLKEHLDQFSTLESDGLIVRMDRREAAIYGAAALDLLHRARATLCAKYDVQLNAPIIIEIFPQQQDFAIRTFGMPGGAGFLGVCFGRVITANSPASQGESPANWQSVLWHEFCHVVTLHKTENKMPRWLSEGISVYEEKQANPTWGQGMTPQYRQMILSGQLVPVSQLSGAFLRPPTPVHLQFAYFESAMVVDFIVQHRGMATLKDILTDLAKGVSINDVLNRHFGAIEQLDQAFEKFAAAEARKLAPNADWERPEFSPRVDMKTVAEWNTAHPKNIWGLTLYARQLIQRNQWDTAKQTLEELRRVFPNDTTDDNADRLLADVYRHLGETENEIAALERLARRDGDAVDVYLRLMVLGQKQGDWNLVLANAERLLAVNPLLPAGHRHLAQAVAHTGNETRAIPAYRALLLMEPVDPADLHYQLARLLFQTNDMRGAERHVLQSLEEAPRYRDALKLLLRIEKSRTAPVDVPMEQAKEAA